MYCNNLDGCAKCAPSMSDGMMYCVECEENYYEQEGACITLVLNPSCPDNSAPWMTFNQDFTTWTCREKCDEFGRHGDKRKMTCTW